MRFHCMAGLNPAIVIAFSPVCAECRCSKVLGIVLLLGKASLDTAVHPEASYLHRVLLSPVLGSPGQHTQATQDNVRVTQQHHIVNVMLAPDLSDPPQTVAA